MTLKELRISGHLTQNEASIVLEIPLRTYKRYESIATYQDKVKYNKAYEALEQYINRQKGLYSIHIQEIKNKFSRVFKKYKIELCFLFGAYSQNKETKDSSIDIMIDSHENFDLMTLTNELSEAMDGKKVNVIKLTDIVFIQELLRKILREGIKIYSV